MKQLLHTPEGVRDIYNSEYAKKLVVESRIRETLQSYGYSELQTPSFEFFDIFNKERGSVASREMYKFFDREGNTLVLRPDMTPPVARCAAKYFMEEPFSIRLSYLANTFINHSSYQGRLKEATVQGAELMGDDSSSADGEMVALTVECLLAAGLKDFQVDVGQVEFFNGLVEEAGLDAETEAHLRELIEEKNFFGVEELVSGQNLDRRIGEIFLKLPELFGSVKLLETAKELALNPRMEAAVRRLENLWRILKLYGLSDYVSFDLGMLGKFQYYTGIIFRGVTFGMGEPVVSGGRYDGLMRQFGKDAPAVGFSISIDGLMSALSRQKIPVRTSGTDGILLYDRTREETAIPLAVRFRKDGKKLQMIRKKEGETLSAYRTYADRNHVDTLYYLSGKPDEFFIWEKGSNAAAKADLPELKEDTP
ncbi:MAG: ATP phosphoribosyltransferase regulatory subunit [Lachnospiraceae bacterium]|nr:ATP phosphoribosyltransferase regulatory subunit [Lachnospiraceae bacterium]